MADSLLADLSRLSCENGFTDLVLTAGGVSKVIKHYHCYVYTHTSYSYLHVDRSQKL